VVVDQVVLQRLDLEMLVDMVEELRVELRKVHLDYLMVQVVVLKLVVVEEVLLV